ncbi:MAG: sigma-70 family RNA polymerase sigma factor [Propionibacteriaceae bacterium]|jgi:RNA polymerase sigma factor (sigma-70 family)|nr:sigma-70 family RNA polymerase sigma factor [Propionibacteriaceae bacterium]
MDRQTIDQRLARQIEAGVIASAVLVERHWDSDATPEELDLLVRQGEWAKHRLVQNHLGLVSVIATAAARSSQGSYADLFQEGCVALHQAVMAYDWHKGPFGPYAGMWIRSAIRSHSRRHQWPAEGLEQIDDTVTEDLERSLVKVALSAAVEALPPEQRQIIELRCGWHGDPLPRQAVADQLGSTVSKVRYLERRGLATVRQRWLEAEAA